LLARGHQPELIAAQGSALGERAASAGVPVHYATRGFANLPAALALRRVLPSQKFDLIHANEAHAVSAAWLSRAHRTVPFVISRRVGYPLSQSKIARARYEAAARIIANSQWTADQAIASGAPKEKITVVFEGTEIAPRLTNEQRISARRRWQQPDGAPLLGCVGVLSPDKGQDWLIRAVAELAAEFPGLRLLLAGDGPCRQQLESLARSLKITDRILFAGFVKDVESVYAALDLFLLPSFFEALNNSLMAAMAYEIPSIAFRRGALPEIIEHNSSGLLVQPENLPELTAAIRRLLQDRAFAKSMAENGRLRIRACFSADRMVDSTLRIYDQCVGAR
jgi:glycosyltransferase involved in cell wall biosynthesis